MSKFKPRVRKQKARLRAAQPPSDENSTAIEIMPESKSEKDARRAQMKFEIASQSQAGASSKKRKRLEKYIDTKIKRQDNLELIKKLGAQRFDTSLLTSSKKLGRSGNSTAWERLAQASEEQRYGLAPDDRESLHSEELAEFQSEPDTIPVEDPVQPALNPTRTSFEGGSGLKRPLEIDEEGNPIITHRKRHKLSHTRRVPIESSADESEEKPETSDSSDSWAGFSDSRRGSEEPEDLSDDEAEVEESESESESNDDEPPEERSSAFKAWAQAQRNAAVGFEPSQNTASAIQPVLKDGAGTSTLSEHPITLAVKAKEPYRSDDTTLSVQPLDETERNVYHVPVLRSDDVETSRKELPVVAKEQEIMETVFQNDVVILTGATGSGKTTQVPQFLFEAGYGDPKSSTPGMIGITQPRRVAAISMANRVAYELGGFTDRVSHQVRFDSTASSRTAVKFMTDGILLREIEQDFTLSKYSAILIDEAHERSVNTDILVGMVGRIVDIRRRMFIEKREGWTPLKLIIMSATIQVNELQRNKTLFRNKPPPVVNVEGRQHHVSTHFARKTKRDYVQEMYEKVSRGHRKLPPGGMLVFLTGQNEIEYLEKRLKTAFPSTEKSPVARPKMHVCSMQTQVDIDDVEVERGPPEESKSNNDDYAAGLSDLDEDGGDDEEFALADEGAASTNRIHILPLFSQLSSDQQSRVFEPPPRDARLIILATNIAETSITIPNIRYVFDTGRSKVKQYDPKTGIQTFAIDWISKASAQQRAGRAGRTGPGGHCYRLYSSAIYEDVFADFADPEITKTPIEGVVLYLKTLGLPDVTKFPFPTPLDSQRLPEAERLLQYLGCLENITNKVTDLGQRIKSYPLSPRLSRILLVAEKQLNMQQHVLSLVAILGMPEVFVSDAQLGLTRELEPSLKVGEEEPVWSSVDAEAAIRRDRLKQERDSFHRHVARADKYCDATKSLVALTDYAAAMPNSRLGSSPALRELRKFTRVKSLKEASQLRSQLTSIMALHGSSDMSASPKGYSIPAAPPSSAQALLLRQIVAAGYIDNLAQRADLSPTPPSRSRNPSNAIRVPYITLFPSRPLGWSKSAIESLDPKSRDLLEYVYVHPSSVLAHVSPQKLPQYVVYSHLSTAENSGSLPSGETTVPRTRVHPLSPVPVETIKELIRGTPLAGEGKPIGKIESLSRNEHGHERRAVWCVPFIKSGSEMAGGREWPLPPARRIIQVRRPRQGWVEEQR
ncbi:MAG: hypothetical protein Q9159_005260 [Coniocarpon cinnabarinum]